jgi:hypothetical protein
MAMFQEIPGAPWEPKEEGGSSEKAPSTEKPFSEKGLLRKQFNLPETAEWDEILETARNFDEQIKETLTNQQQLCKDLGLPIDSSWEKITEVARQKEDAE